MNKKYYYLFKILLMGDKNRKNEFLLRFTDDSLKSNAGKLIIIILIFYYYRS